MKFEEHAAKPLLAAAGIEIPKGQLCRTAEAVAEAAAAIGPCMVKAQVPAGQRSKTGGVLPAEEAETARFAALQILGMAIGDHPVEQVLVEARVPIVRAFYAAIVNDQANRAPLLLFSAEGGMAIEALIAQHPERIAHLPIDLRAGLDEELLRQIMKHLGLAPAEEALVELCLKLYDVYRVTDAELIEINPLALTADGRLMALDCKLVVDDAALFRRATLAANGVPERRTVLETKAQAHGLDYIELDGEVGVLADGAGLAMATMDAIRHHGGQPANFLTINGAARELGKPALEVLLARPEVRSLLIHLGGAQARADCLVTGLLEAWPALQPTVPAFFSIHGAGAAEATAMVRDRLGSTPFDLLDDAAQAAVEAAR